MPKISWFPSRSRASNSRIPLIIGLRLTGQPGASLGELGVDAIDIADEDADSGVAW